jgi:hypothetical protein
MQECESVSAAGSGEWSNKGQPGVRLAGLTRQLPTDQRDEPVPAMGARIVMATKTLAHSQGNGSIRPYLNYPNHTSVSC